jgi:hypothetical protein
VKFSAIWSQQAKYAPTLRAEPGDALYFVLYSLTSCLAVTGIDRSLLPHFFRGVRFALLHARRRLATVRLVRVYSNICSGQSDISLGISTGSPSALVLGWTICSVLVHVRSKCF